MKIIVGSSEVCGMIFSLGKEWKRQGHEVITISGYGNPFYNYQYDINPDNLIFSFLYFKTGSKKISTFLSYSISKISVLKRGFESLIIKTILDWADCYVQIYSAGLWEEERQLKYLYKKQKKIITLFVGSEIRDYAEFKIKFNIRHWNFTDEINLPGPAMKLQKLRLHEKYSTAIFSVPDQSFKALRPYFHLQLPLNTTEFVFNIPNRTIPLVLHAPSNLALKGTDLILETLDRLKAEGVKFELILLKGIPHSELLKILTNADILIDEIVLHGPGFLSLEAMLSGCVVATKYLENSPDCFRPPLVNINEDNIITELRELLTNKELRINLANKGREYVLKNNAIGKVAGDILNKLNDTNFDYYPGTTYN